MTSLDSVFRRYQQGKEFMMRRCACLGVMFLAGWTMLISGCAGEKPQSGSPKMSGPPATVTPPVAKPPGDAGSTTGGGTETPSTPGDGQ